MILATGSSIFGPDIDNFIRALFGQYWFFWIGSAVIVVTVYLMKGGVFKKEVIEVPEPPSRIMTATQYLDSKQEEPESIATALPPPPYNSQERARKYIAEMEGKTTQLVPHTKNNGEAIEEDANVIKLKQAFKDAQDRLIDEFVITMRNLRLQVSLPEKSQAVSPSTPLPPQEIEE